MPPCKDWIRETQAGLGQGMLIFLGKVRLHTYVLFRLTKKNCHYVVIFFKGPLKVQLCLKMSLNTITIFLGNLLMVNTHKYTLN